MLVHRQYHHLANSMIVSETFCLQFCPLLAPVYTELCKLLILFTCHPVWYKEG